MTGTSGFLSPDVLVDRIVAHAWTEARSTTWSPIRSGRRTAAFAADDVTSLSKARAALTSASAERSMAELKRAYTTLTVAIGTAQEHLRFRSHAS
jgi:hypothetical protein